MKRIQIACIQFLVCVILSGCSVKQMAINSVGNALSGGGTVFSGDDDPELIKDALPFSLKLMESVLAQTPKHEGLLLQLSSGFTQYGYGFVQLEADQIEEDDYERSEELRARAIKLYLRGRDYGLRGLGVRYPEFGAALRTNAGDALANLKVSDVPMAYWTALSWAGAISLSIDNPALVGELALVEKVMERCLELDSGFDNGAIHSFYIAYEMGRLNGTGDPIQRATEHYLKAKELSGGMMASVYVSYAESVALDQMDRELFVSLLQQAIAIDVDAKPEWRLNNLLYKDRAKWLLGRVDDLIF